MSADYERACGAPSKGQHVIGAAADTLGQVFDWRAVDATHRPSRPSTGLVAGVRRSVQQTLPDLIVIRSRDIGAMTPAVALFRTFIVLPFRTRCSHLLPAAVDLAGAGLTTDRPHVTPRVPGSSHVTITTRSA